MLIKQLPRIAVIAALAFAGSLSVQAQQSQASDAQKQQAKPVPAKPAVVWTDDNISSVRSPADNYVAQKRAAEAAAAAAAQAAAAAKPVPKPTTKDRAPATLSNPKTAEDADGMIAWENRDIAAQQQFLQELQKRLDSAPPDQKARLQQDLQAHAQTLAETQKERDALIAQKQQLEKKPAAGSGTSSPNQQ